MNRRPTGFTLVEILIVVLILAILAALVIPRYQNMRGEAYMATAQTFKKSLQSAASLYFSDHHTAPQSFWSFLAYSQYGSDMNYLQIDKGMRDQLLEPEAELVTNNDRTITLVFKNGLQAVYTIDTNGSITAEITEP